MNSCTCPHPPGGVVHCPDDHVAICRVVNGHAESECIPPDSSLSEEAQAGRILEIITGIPFSGRLTVTELAILYAGEYESPDGSMRVTFKLPLSGTADGGASMSAAPV
jgi:hypothetical protein